MDIDATPTTTTSSASSSSSTSSASSSSSGIPTVTLIAQQLSELQINPPLPNKVLQFNQGSCTLNYEERIDLIRQLQDHPLWKRGGASVCALWLHHDHGLFKLFFAASKFKFDTSHALGVFQDKIFNEHLCDDPTSDSLVPNAGHLSFSYAFSHETSGISQLTLQPSTTPDWSDLQPLSTFPPSLYQEALSSLKKMLDESNDSDEDSPISPAVPWLISLYAQELSAQPSSKKILICNKSTVFSASSSALLSAENFSIFSSNLQSSFERQLSGDEHTESEDTTALPPYELVAMVPPGAPFPKTFMEEDDEKEEHFGPKKNF